MADSKNGLNLEWTSFMNQLYKSGIKDKNTPSRNEGPSPIHQGPNDIAKLREALGIKPDMKFRTVDFQSILV